MCRMRRQKGTWRNKVSESVYYSVECYTVIVSFLKKRLISRKRGRTSHLPPKIPYSFRHCCCHQWRHRICKLLLLQTNRSHKSAPVRERLQPAGFSERQTTVLRRMNEHRLSIMAYGDCWSIIN